MRYAVDTGTAMLFRCAAFFASLILFVCSSLVATANAQGSIINEIRACLEQEQSLARVMTQAKGIAHRNQCEPDFSECWFNETRTVEGIADDLKMRHSLVKMCLAKHLNIRDGSAKSDDYSSSMWIIFSPEVITCTLTGIDTNWSGPGKYVSGFRVNCL